MYIFSQINGDAGDNTLNGTSDNERIDGGLGNDVINAGAGNDLLLSGGADLDFDGIDILNGQAGDDVLVAQGGFAILRGGQGNDTLLVTNEFGDPDWDFVRADYGDAPAGIVANLTTGSPTSGGVNPVNVPGSFEIADGFGTIDTVSGMDVIGDSDHNDFIFVDNSFSNGFTEVRLSEGDDFVDFTGASGGRRISYKNAEDGVDASLVSQSATDNNSVIGDQIGTDTFVNANQLRGSDFDDILTGNGGSNRLRGSGGNDQIDGGGGIDRIDHFDSPGGIVVDLSAATNQVSDDGFGTSDSVVNVQNVHGSYFDDTITGDSADNELVGYSGADTLNGGAGSDTLTGGEDADTFVIDAVYPVEDTITDYNVTEGDLVDISAILDDAFLPGSPDVHVTTVVTGDNTEVSVDTNVSPGQDFTHVVTLTGVTSGTFNFIYDDSNNEASVTIA